MLEKLQLWFIPCKENNYRPHFLKSKFLVWCVLILFILKIVLVSFLWYFPKTALFAEVNRVTLLDLANKERQNLNLNSLKEDPKLDEAAYLKAQDMLENDYFAHTSPSGISPWYWFEVVGYDYQYAGENLAIDFLDSEELHTAWINSPSHRANILSPNFKDIGIAVVKGDFKGRETTVVVQLFGAPREVAEIPATKNQEVQQTLNQTQPSTSPISAPTQTQTQTQNSSIPTPTSQATSEKSLYSYYLEKGEKLPSFEERALLFEKYGLGSASTYRGTPEQNNALLNKIIEAEKSLSSKETEEITQQPTEESETKEETIEENATSKEKELTPEEKALLEKARAEEKPIFSAGEIKGAQIKRDSFQFKFLNFMTQNYDKITKVIFLAVLVMILISLCLDVFLRTDLQSKDLILRGLIYCFILLALFLLDKDLILELIPHNLGIL
ncbi:MAG TPA: CAP domain-containing protein [Candidatus Pacearchaeota archaeon]|nr:CAP domain-containing protein [Candidatus Pacearchaeota archaeon]HOK94215.1 CAP domain-containing protein [Candidatus Pacearchaeota archaeon]HPO75401.1 CAP domain-containing protein [Candidatus Pacearchaeota archaeon]